MTSVSTTPRPDARTNAASITIAVTKYEIDDAEAAPLIPIAARRTMFAAMFAARLTAGSASSGPPRPVR
jgi:hypothetical protein